MFSRELRIVTLRLIKAHPWHMTRLRQQRLAQRWVDECVELFGMPHPIRVRIDGRLRGYLGHFTVWQGRVTGRVRWVITLRHFSVVTLLHEFRHAMQTASVAPLGDGPGREADAIGWSVALYATVAPRRFSRLVELGRIGPWERALAQAFLAESRKNLATCQNAG